MRSAETSHSTLRPAKKVSESRTGKPGSPTYNRVVELAVVIVSIANVVIFASLAAWLWSTVRHRKGEALRLAAGLATLAMVGLAVGAASRAFTKSVQQGWIPLDRAAVVVNGTQIAVSIATLAVGIATAFILRRNMTRLIGVATTFDVVTARSAPVSPDDWHLTPRQTEVLQAIIGGSVSDEDLAATLYISKHTASTHVKQILHKTGVSSRRDLPLLAPFVDGAGDL